jgi:hypothetical protein
MEKIKIRQAHRGDAYDIANIQIQTWRYSYSDILPNEYLQKMDITKKIESWQKDIEERQSEYIFVADYN